MSVAPFTRRIPKYFRKVVAFTGAANLGAQGTVPIGTVTGAVLITHLMARCTENLAGATATVELGTADNTAGLIAQTTATDIDANDFWKDSSPEVKVSDAIVNKVVNANIILTVATADVTDGTLIIEGYYLPLSPDGMLSAAA